MALIVEDGSGVTGATSYVALVAAQALVDTRGVSVTLTEALLLRAMDAFAGLRWVGIRTSMAQALAWPRVGAYDAEGELIAADAIPAGLVAAQVWLAVAIDGGDDPAAVPEAAVRREVVGPIETEYTTRSGSTTALSLLAIPRVRDALRGLVAVGGRIERA